MEVLRRSPRPGIKALLEKAGLDQQNINETDIGFTIGPRINIASRMGSGIGALELLTTKDKLVARTIADDLEEKNKQRRKWVDMIIDGISAKYEGKELPSIIVEGSAEWMLGVLGLTCNRLVEKYSRPIILWTRNHAGEIKGSLRSDGSVDVVELMEEAGGDKFFKDLKKTAKA